jgi:DNA phosphorothioation-associated putative methyltransferase
MIDATPEPRSQTPAPGKTVVGRRYLHVAAVNSLDDAVRARVERSEALVGLIRGEGYNVVRLEPDGAGLALLHYPGFFDEPFPALAASWLVDPEAASVAYRTYADSLNPPILHRKELLLPLDHPRRSEFAALTEACETIGLFDAPTRIGYRRQWEQFVQEKGYRVVGHQLVPLGNDESAGPETGD